MRENEYTSIIWIHHLTTFLGFLSAVKAYRHVRGKSPAKRAGLFLFAGVQMFAICKIISDLAEGRSRLREYFRKIHSVSKNGYEERGLLWSLCALSVLWKLGFPFIFSNK